jgi:hypothetical protein
VVQHCAGKHSDDSLLHLVLSGAQPGLEAQLKCLQDCAQTEPIFKADLQALKKLKLDCDWIDEVVPAKKRLSNAEL